MPLFTGAYSDPLAASPHPGMQTALLTARQALSLIGTPNVDRLALIAVGLTGFAGTNNHPWAAIRDTEVHYSASLLKARPPRCMLRLTCAPAPINWPSPG